MKDSHGLNATYFPHYLQILGNSHGPMQVFSYSPEALGSYPAPQYFPTITMNHARIQEVFHSIIGKILCAKNT